MAKKSRLEVSRGSVGSASPVPSADRLRELFTAAERKVLTSSDGPALAKASHADVRNTLKLARELRDKWRGLAGAQARSAKRTPTAAAEANARTSEKAAVFAGAVSRLESRLSVLQPGGGPKPRSKAARTAAHRTTRASVRAGLSKRVAALNEVEVVRAAATKPASVRSEAVVAKPVAAARADAKSARRTKRPPITAAAAGSAQPIRFDRSKQRTTHAKAKNARIKLKGVTTRRGGHVLASGKRAQARRDQRAR